MSRNRSNVVPLPVKAQARKSDLNHGKEGSVRAIDGRIYMDFYYLDVRVRENTGLLWSDKNASQARPRRYSEGSQARAPQVPRDLS